MARRPQVAMHLQLPRFSYDHRRHRRRRHHHHHHHATAKCTQEVPGGCEQFLSSVISSFAQSSK